LPASYLLAQLEDPLRLSRRLLVPPLAAALGLAGTLGLATATAAHADTTTTVQNLTGFDQMAVDSADGYVFLSGSVSGTSAIAVTNLSGQYVTTLDSGAGAAGLALDGSTLYAVLRTQDAIGVIDASGTPTQTTTIKLPAGDTPISIAVQSGALWVSYANTSVSFENGGVGEINPSTHAFQPVATGLYEAPTLAADPSDSGVLVAATSIGLNVFDTAVTPVTQTSGGLPGGCSNLWQIAVAPGGAQFMIACSFPYEIVASSTATPGTISSTYVTGAYPAAVAVANDGTVIAGLYGEGNTGIQVFSPNGTEINAIQPPGGMVAGAGIALSPDGSKLYVVSDSGSSPYSLNVYDSPEVTRSTLTLTGPSTQTPGTSVTLTGQLAFAAGAPPVGTPITITRTPSNGTPTTLAATATTDANGDFTVTDTPPGIGSYTYTASYAGSSATAGSPATAAATAGFTTAVALINTTLTLGPGTASVIKGNPVTLNGNLSFASGKPAPGTPVSVSRLNPNGTTTPITGVTTSDASGDFAVTDDTATATGTYTYTVSVAATQTTASAQATAQVTVTLNPATLALRGPSSVLSGKTFLVSGTLSLGSGTPATGTTITFTRKNPNGSSVAITGVKTAAGGTFGFSQNFSALGTYSYSASVPATATTTAATATFKVAVAKAAPALTLGTGASTALYDSTIHVTAHLGGSGTNRTVSIYYQLVGSGTRKLIETAKVNSSGNLTVSYPAATRNVIFTTTFSGDTQYNARSVSDRIGVDARLAMTNSGWYTSAEYIGVKFWVYHSTGHLNFAVTVTPDKHGETLELVGQQWYDNAWTTVPGDTFTYSLNGSSKVSGYLVLTDATGGYYRVRAVFVPSGKDVTNVSYYSGWFYFHVVK
jgi:5-hydroxyisourate hydrolase-like protein (transthyretin family)